jgi:flagellar biosynthesis protein FliQ
VLPDVALQLTASMLWTCFKVCLPILGLTLAVGLVVSILQVITQIQEMSMTFIPKLIAAGVSLLLFGPWMLSQITQFAKQLWMNIPSIV